MTYDLSVLSKNSICFKKMIDMYFGSDILSVHKVGEGFYGVVYLINLKKDPFKVIIKFYKHKGRYLLENQQLDLLRKYSLEKIPQTYYIHNYSEDVPFEAIIMEFIEGINASKLPSDHPNKDKFADDMIRNLIHLHSISNDKGFGSENEIYPDWNSCIGNRIIKLHRILHDEYKDRVSSFVMQVTDKSMEAFNNIFAEPVKKSSLIHSDYNLWNILVDEKSAEITAIIDPIDAGWADKEMDLFHLQNADGDRFGLLDRYKHYSELSKLFDVKNAFYWFWDDIKHMENIGWYDEERFSSFGRKLIGLIEKI